VVSRQHGFVKIGHRKNSIEVNEAWAQDAYPPFSDIILALSRGAMRDRLRENSCPLNAMAQVHAVREGEFVAATRVVFHPGASEDYAAALGWYYSRGVLESIFTTSS
jgi:hypothetical protein